jgi:hypothetical protein
VVAVTGDILDSLLKLDATIQKEIKKSLEH